MAATANRRLSRHEAASLFFDSVESQWRGQEAFSMWLIERLHPHTVVDLGFHCGLSTLIFAYKNQGHVFGIDWFEGSYSQKAIVLDKTFRTISDAIGLNIVKNIHLIIGPEREISNDWNRPIDLLHMDLISTYDAAKRCYANWKRFLTPRSVLLVHDLNQNEELLRFFSEIQQPKLILDSGKGMGVATEDRILLEAIRQKPWQLPVFDCA